MKRCPGRPSSWWGLYHKGLYATVLYPLRCIQLDMRPDGDADCSEVHLLSEFANGYGFLPVPWAPATVARLGPVTECPQIFKRTLQPFQVVRGRGCRLRRRCHRFRNEDHGMQTSVSQCIVMTDVRWPRWILRHRLQLSAAVLWVSPSSWVWP